MSYQQRLSAAAKIVLHSDSVAGDAQLNFEEIGITATLKPHQLEGVSWLIRRYTLGVNVILDGTGEDLTSYCFSELFEVLPKITGTILVTDSWVSEIEKFALKLRPLRYIGEKEHRKTFRRKIYDHVQSHLTSTVLEFPFDVLLTTYDIALLDQDFLSQFPWHFAVIDEAQRLKNPSSVLYNVLKQRFVIPRCLLMTGTPIQNNLTELWALLHFCMPSIFGTLEQFLSAFKEAGDPSSVCDNDKVNEQLTALRSILRAFMLRRTKSKLIQCGTLSLPPLTEITVMVPLVALQKKVYLSILRKELPKLLAFASGTSGVQSLQNIVIHLRKACSHPYLFPGIEPEPYEEGEHLVLASGKLIILDHLLQRLHSSGHRVLLFAQMTHTLDILQDYFELRKYSYERLDGSIRAEERFAAIRNFSPPPSHGQSSSKSDESSAFVFMISTRAGGVGLNLVAADTVIFYEQDWNPRVDRQALQRAHRIGQMNHVLSISLVAGNTIEEVIMRRAQRKLQLSDNVIGENVSIQEKGLSGAEPGDLRSIIYGLHKFDLTEASEEKLGEPNMSVLSAIADKVISKRSVLQEEDNGKLEISPMDLDGRKLEANTAAGSLDVDESSYLSWVENFKEMSQRVDDSALEPGYRKRSDEEKKQRIEAARKKAEEKKLSKWQSLGYQSLSIGDPFLPQGDDMMSDNGAVQFVLGDSTRPSTTEPIIIFSCCDDSGNWGRGGMFDSLAKLSTRVPEAYERASEFGDLHLGDLHLIELNDDADKDGSPPKWVALAIVQSYNPKRKVPRSAISIPDLESCIAKASFSAAQKSASIHMPRVGYQDGSDRAVWYSTERLLRKYASIYGVKIFVYYYKRSLAQV